MNKTKLMLKTAAVVAAMYTTPAFAQNLEGDFADSPEFSNFITANNLSETGCPRGAFGQCNPIPSEPNSMWRFVTFYICSGVAGAAGVASGIAVAAATSEFITPIGGAIAGGAVGATVNDGVKDGCIKVTKMIK